LVVEIVAALGLVAVLVFAVSLLRNINRESSQAQAAEVANLPTPEPTPLITAVVLPGGHTPPTDPGGAQPNYDEVPARLRPAVEQQFAGPVVVPTPSPAHAIQLQIPAIGVDAPIVQGDGWEQLKKGVAQHLGTANPGQPGNVVLSAHNDIYGQIFRRLDALSPGDEVIVRTQTQTFTYRVVNWHTVGPTDVSVMDQTPESIVTLISCYPYLVNTERIVVIAELQQ
jgi:sortase A